MNSKRCSDDLRIDLDEGLTTTREDIDALRRLRAHAPSWLDLTPEELDRLVPAQARDRHRPAPRGRLPFTLE